MFLGRQSEPTLSQENRPMAAKAAKPATRTLGNYQLLEKLGEGGMGSVFRARHRSTGQIVAIKIIAPEMTANSVLVERFKQEYRTAKGLDHPHLVKAIDFGFDGSQLYMVVEYVDGCSLGDRIETEQRLQESEAVSIVVQIADALDLAHRHKIIHRDVKPDNILMDSTGDAKLIDLGLAKNLGADLDLTRPLSGLGTPNFMAPEQFADAKRADARCDIYSLGATLYMAITGELPFQGKTNLNIVKLKMQDNFTPTRKLTPAVSEHVDEAIRRSMIADPRKRYSSCLEFIAALTSKPTTRSNGAESGSGPGVAAKPSRTPERRAAVRFSTSLEASCQPTGRVKERSWSGEIYDISSTGVCLLLRRRFEPGTILTAELQGKQDCLTKTMLVRVLRVREESRRRWSIGCSFDRQLSDVELTSLI
jgi:serine/threonine protein kinase